MAHEDLIRRTFVELADTLVEGYDVIEFLHMLAQRCVEVLDVAEVGVVLFDARGHVRPLASSSERMRYLELIELQRQDGPCLDCCRQGVAIQEHGLEKSERWPTFRPTALAAGVASVYAVPLRLRADRLGALNLFADRPHGLAEDGQMLAQALADVATIGILHQRVLHERDTLTRQLQTALNSRVALEQAKGLVAEQAGVDVDDAFQLLRNHARHHNRYIGEVVAAVINRELSASDLRITPAARGTGPA